MEALKLSARHEPQGALEVADFLWLAGSLCQFFRMPFDAALLASQFPPPHDHTTVQAALKSLGFKVGVATPDKHGKLPSDVPLPAIAYFRERPDNDKRADQAADPRKDPSESSDVALLLRRDDARLLYMVPGSDTPHIVPADQLSETFQALIVVGRESNAGNVEDQDPGFTQKPFSFRWFIPELLKHRSIWRDVLLASLAIQLMGLATPLLTQVTIDKVVVHHTKSTLIVVGVAMVMFMLFSAAMSWLRQYLIIHTGNRIDAVLGSKVFTHLFRLPVPYFAARPTGTLIARLQGIETIRNFVTGAAVALALDLPFLFIFLAVMFLYSWELSLIALGILTLISLISAVIAPMLRARLDQQFLLGARNQAFLTEYVSGMETVKSLQMEPTLNQRYGDYLASYLKSAFSTRQLGNTYQVSANALEQTLTLSILVVGALIVMRNEGFTVGMLVAFQMFASRMSQPMLRLVGLWQEFQQANLAVKRLGDVMNAPAEPYALAPTRSGDGPGRIEMLNLSFRYSEHHPYLFRNLKLALKPGALTVLMGPSGSGKSTLAKLLQGFYMPSDGLIRIDGTDLRHMSANELRSQFGVVPQETTLFSGTVYDNLLLAQPHANFKQIIQACKAAEIHTTIEQLPQGYQTPLGEHGVGLSGGQKQRLAIARALLKRPKVLIFDEATSNLDAETSKAFATTINSIKGKATILFITHAVPEGLAADETLVIGFASSSLPEKGT